CVIGEVEFVLQGVGPADVPDESGELKVAPLSAPLEVRRQVGGREMRLDVRVLQLDSVGVTAPVGARAPPLQSDEQLVVALDRHPADLDVAERRGPAGSPELDRVREDVRIHEWAPAPARTELTQLAPGVAEVEGRLSRIASGPEQVELEDRLDLTDARRDPALPAEAARAHARPVSL